MTFQLSKKGFLGWDPKLATLTYKFGTQKVIFSGPKQVEDEIQDLGFGQHPAPLFKT